VDERHRLEDIPLTRSPSGASGASHRPNEVSTHARTLQCPGEGGRRPSARLTQAFATFRTRNVERDNPTVALDELASPGAAIAGGSGSSFWGDVSASRCAARSPMRMRTRSSSASRAAPLAAGSSRVSLPQVGAPAFLVCRQPAGHIRHTSGSGRAAGVHRATAGHRRNRVAS
jgi:hypothetical protein